MRKPLVIANWKMHGSRPANASLVAHIRRRLGEGDAGVDVALCPPFVYLAEVAVLLEGSALQLGAQDLSASEAGAHTGDVAGEMLRELACRYVLVGHSERRAEHGETDALVARKYGRAIAAGLQPVLCVGETLAEREAGQTLAVVTAQLEAVLREQKSSSAMVIAYEPVWAIGTGQTATEAQVQEVHQFIRQRLGARGESSSILYGGSVKPENAAGLFRQPDVDGGLIGGASLEAESFVAICRAASRSNK
jgi:triosephosphate isomerase